MGPLPDAESACLTVRGVWVVLVLSCGVKNRGQESVVLLVVGGGCGYTNGMVLLAHPGRCIAGGFFPS